MFVEATVLCKARDTCRLGTIGLVKAKLADSIVFWRGSHSACDVARESGCRCLPCNPGNTDVMQLLQQRQLSSPRKLVSKQRAGLAEDASL